MQITDIKFRHVEPSGRLRALVSVTFDGVLAVHDIKIIDGHDRLFLAMPSHPVGNALRQEMEHEVLDAYRASFLQ